jgi:hypothetical protein
MIPSERGSNEAIVAAQKALADYAGRFWPGNPGKLELEFYELDLLKDSEQFMALDIILDEIMPGDRVGPPPPNDVSTHPPFPGFPLYAFCWSSAHFGKRMYFKFALISGSGKTRLAVYSLHEPRELV